MRRFYWLQASCYYRETGYSLSPAWSRMRQENDTLFIRWTGMRVGQ